MDWLRGWLIAWLLDTSCRRSIALFSGGSESEARTSVLHVSDTVDFDSAVEP